MANKVPMCAEEPVQNQILSAQNSSHSNLKLENN